MRYKIGDELVLKVDSSFGYRDKTYRPVRVQVIGHNTDNDSGEAEYLVYVPPYETLSGTWTLGRQHANWYGVDHKFIGDDVAFIKAGHPIFKHHPAPDGERCDRCREFFAGAERADDGSYRCRACRLDPWR